MADAHADVEALAARLQGAEERLKAASPVEASASATPASEPQRSPASGVSPGQRPAAHASPPLAASLERLEAAGAAVRAARLRVAELQARLTAG